ncbi:collagen alpha-1(XII) chain-like [Hemicordylus capensis]|uniref:collagen alpha-1(XII) chain-like n=1 Tax=Hemicordylus capensis TaxID=884348 RepID=UPI0023029EA0|nr:collagen alpha-1(XII) chain-like [Hemicordylus capensis]
MASMLLFLALLHFFPVGVAGLESQTSAEAEIVFLVDGSWSIGRPNFRAMRHFLGSVVDAFDIGPDKVQIAVAQYSGDPRTEWHLNSYSTKQTLMDAIARLPYKGGNTLTGTALNFTLSNHFNAQAGLRPGAHKIVVLITDGKSQDDVKAPTARVKEAGVELFAVGIKNHDVTELREISSDPAETHVYSVRDFSLLGDIVDDLTNNLRNSIKE